MFGVSVSCEQLKVQDSGLKSWPVVLILIAYLVKIRSWRLLIKCDKRSLLFQIVISLELGKNFVATLFASRSKMAGSRAFTAGL